MGILWTGSLFCCRGIWNIIRSVPSCNHTIIIQNLNQQSIIIDSSIVTAALHTNV